MATMNPFDLLGDDENDDPSQLIAAQQQKLAQTPKKTPVPAQVAAQPAKQPPKLPSKPLPPTQSVREAKNDAQRGGSRGGGCGFNRDFADNENTFGSSNGFSGGFKSPEDGEAGKPFERRGYGGPHGGFRGGRRGDVSNGEVAEGERPQRVFERRSGTGRGNEIKRDGAGRGNWGSPTDELAPETEEPVIEGEKNVDAEKPLGQEEVVEANKENPVKEPEEELEDKEMTLEEYEKVLEEKRKALLALKTEERKVDLDKELKSMQLLSNKKNDDDVFIRLGSEKDKRKEAAEKEERAKKSVSINEFLKPADGGSYNHPVNRGRGRGCGSGRGGYNSGSSMRNNVGAPSIEDIGLFPSLGAK